MEETATTKEEVVKFIENMTVLELSKFVKELEEKFGVTAAPAMPVGMQMSAAQPAEAKEEKTEFTVVLTSAGSNKIQVIKEVRAITGLGLKDAKDLVDGAPKTVKEGIAKAEAEEMKKKLEAVGATIELK